MPRVAPASAGSTCAAESPTLARCGVAPSVPVRADECLASSAVAQETKIALTVARMTRVIAITTGTWLDWSVRMLLDEPSETSCERSDASRPPQQGDLVDGEQDHPHQQNCGMQTRVVNTSVGSVEIALAPGVGEVVVCFPGGHTTAATPLCAGLYAELGYRLLTFSRPGYGDTDVGDLTAAEFVPAIAEVCERLAFVEAAATVGLSLGGLQAVHVAAALPQLAPRLILHSCAPSSRPYPDTLIERLGAPVAFGPHFQRLTWRAVRITTSSDTGLRAMMASLSRLPVSEWWDSWTAADRAAARSTFANMDSGTGFMTDLRQASGARSAYRASVLRSVPCPTLVTASRHEGRVDFAHAKDFQRAIPHARLVETGAPSHFFWLGAARHTVAAAISNFMAE
jgi:pimeloyl-ACP methyl ester carboxylesterase